ARRCVRPQEVGCVTTGTTVGLAGAAAGGLAAGVAVLMVYLLGANRVVRVCRVGLQPGPIERAEPAEGPWQSSTAQGPAHSRKWTAVGPAPHASEPSQRG